MKDGVVVVMWGVVFGVSVKLLVFDLSYENMLYDIWEVVYWFN